MINIILSKMNKEKIVDKDDHYKYKIEKHKKLLRCDIYMFAVFIIRNGIMSRVKEQFTHLIIRKKVLHSKNSTGGECRRNQYRVCIVLFGYHTDESSNHA